MQLALGVQHLAQGCGWHPGGQPVRQLQRLQLFAQDFNALSGGVGEKQSRTGAHLGEDLRPTGIGQGGGCKAANRDQVVRAIKVALQAVDEVAGALGRKVQVLALVAAL